MPKLIPLPTRLISDIEELRPALKDASEWQRTLMRIAGLGDAEKQIVENVWVNLMMALRIVDRMRSREWDIVEDGKDGKEAKAPDAG